MFVPRVWLHRTLSIWPMLSRFGLKNVRLWASKMLELDRGLDSSGHQVGSWITAGISHLECEPQELNTTRNWALGCLAISLGWAWDGLEGEGLGRSWDGLKIGVRWWE